MTVLRIRILGLVGGLMPLLMSFQVQAYENRCRYYPEGDTSSLCRGRSIPSSETRGRSRSVLICAGSVYNHQRHPEPVPRYDEWAKLIRLEGSKSEEAHQIRSTEPRIKWSGTIPFSVGESWNWISCDLVTDGYKCGTHQVCRDVAYTYQTCDKDNNCTTHSDTKRVCEDVPNTCYVDVNRTGHHSCSVEKISFEAEMMRDPNWTPKNRAYSEFIPNKYDLLPGEVELFQINSTNGGGILNPSVQVGDAWNSYRMDLSGSSVGAACAQRSDLTLDVKVNTIGRLTKPSPNAFRRPVRADGTAMPIFRYQPTSNANDEPINGRPILLRLADTSANLVDLMAKQSRDQGRREELKDELGLNGKPSTEDAAKMSSFFKNTQLRVRLFEDKWYGKSSFSPPLFIGDGDAISSAHYSLSEIQVIRNSEYWEIPLANDEVGATLYQNTAWLTKMLGVQTKGLKPNQRYRLELSMFQKGVPFYYQLCSEENPEKEKCFKSQAEVFSKPIEVNFWTHPDYDERPWYVKLNDFTLADYLHRKLRSRPTDDENVSIEPLLERLGDRK